MELFLYGLCRFMSLFRWNVGLVLNWLIVYRLSFQLLVNSVDEFLIFQKSIPIG